MAGSGRDATTNTEVWRVAKINPLDGSTIEFWLDEDTGGDSRALSVYERNDRIVMGGYIDAGSGPDFAVIMLEADDDDDGVSNSVDICPDDATKSEDEGPLRLQLAGRRLRPGRYPQLYGRMLDRPQQNLPGVCGCEAPDADGDGDGALDCVDECPEDPDKTILGVCGCFAPDNDDDGDGLLNCLDACLDTPAGDSVDAFGCSGNEATDDPDDTGDEPPVITDAGVGCGCSSANPALAGWIVPILGLLLLRRRR